MLCHGLYLLMMNVHACVVISQRISLFIIYFVMSLKHHRSKCQILLAQSSKLIWNVPTAHYLHCSRLLWKLPYIRLSAPFIFLYSQSNPSRIITRHAWLGSSGRAPLPLHDVSSTLSSQKAARLWEVKTPKARVLCDIPHSLLESHWLLALLHTQKISSLNRTFPFSWHIALASMGSFHIIQARMGFSTSQTSSQSPAPPLHSSTICITLLSMSLTDFFFHELLIWILFGIML